MHQGKDIQQAPQYTTADTHLYIPLSQCPQHSIDNPNGKSIGGMQVQCADWGAYHDTGVYPLRPGVMGNALSNQVIRGGLKTDQPRVGIAPTQPNSREA